jgi:hypothetical protein
MDSEPAGTGGRPPGFMSLWVQGLQLSIIGILVPSLAVFVPAFVLSHLARGFDGLIILVVTVWSLLIAPFIVCAWVGLASLELRRFGRLLAAGGDWPGAGWWLGLRWMLAIAALAAVGRYGIREPAEALVTWLLELLDATPAWRTASRWAALVLLYLPAWGVLAWWTGFRTGWFRPAAHAPQPRTTDPSSLAP